MENSLITFVLGGVISTIVVYLRKIYVETRQEEQKAKYELEKHFGRLEKKSNKDKYFDAKYDSAVKLGRLKLRDKERLLNSDKAKEYAEAARSIGSVGHSALKCKNPPPTPPKKKRKEEFEEYGSQDNSAFLDMLDHITKEIDSPAKKNFVKLKTVDRNLKDPTTGDRLKIVKCFCDAIYEECSYDAYGCDCETKIINKK